MANITTRLEYTAHLDRGYAVTPLIQGFATGDQDAHQIVLHCYEREGVEADVGGAGVAGYYIRRDGTCILLQGIASGSTATVTLGRSCYAQPGAFALIIKLTRGSVVNTVFWGEGRMRDASADEYIDPDGALPSMEQLLAIVQGMEQVAAQLMDQIPDLPDPIVLEAAGEYVETEIASPKRLQIAQIYGRTTQTGSPAPAAPVTLESVGRNGSVVMSVAGQGDAQYVTIPTAGGLHGIPVASGGNYTDASGQQWLADEIDLAAGTVTRRFHAVRLTSTSHVWNAGAVAGRFNTNNPAPAMMKGAVPMCSHFVGTATFSALQTGMVCNNDGTQLIFATSLPDLNAWKNWLDNNEVWLVYRVSVVKAEKLPDDVLATFRAMRTSAAQSSIINDAGAWMRIGYVADTKAYIDRMLGGDA